MAPSRKSLYPTKHWWESVPGEGDRREDIKKDWNVMLSFSGFCVFVCPSLFAFGDKIFCVFFWGDQSIYLIPEGLLTRVEALLCGCGCTVLLLTRMVSRRWVGPKERKWVCTQGCFLVLASSCHSASCRSWVFFVTPAQKQPRPRPPNSNLWAYSKVTPPSLCIIYLIDPAIASRRLTQC